MSDTIDIVVTVPRENARGIITTIATAGGQVQKIINYNDPALQELVETLKQSPPTVK